MRNHWIYVAIGFIAGAALFLSTAWQRTPPVQEVTLKLEKTSRLHAPTIQTSFVMERFGPATAVE
ncbi:MULTISPECIES: hypothetical protein [Sinorhizobium]|uniref:Uncharacterized protein n=2 Tax=Sinorhizobium TaxID=28105 RepID=A0A2S3YPR6_9HYPH|nr:MULTISPECIES: hypothetical protein [Sinorhizobium]ASY56996.1 putative transmembrane protein [Sinorhizobium sp. CCBAU 05631]AUX76806.1 hypothetical protein NXT3_CH02241 [Sinorhizobium fredii]POH31734.1 hypothetical protein ATY30_09840 [Sinorhizobium americanum]POH32926.1 hypothetical protein ATY31_13665 [Sinorhizobium americanum]